MEISILKYIDILIGLALVMILVSPAVTALTQLALTISMARSRHLQAGLARLISQLDPATLRGWADRIAEMVLRHPMVSPRANPLRSISAAIVKRWPGAPEMLKRLANRPGARGSVVEREELIRVLLEIAGTAVLPAAGTPATTAAQALRVAINNNGLGDPAARLKRIRAAAQTLESAQPSLAAHVRQMRAIVGEAKSDFVGKIGNWFDQVMDRVTQAYAQWARVWTVLAAGLVAFVIQLDSIDLIKRLAVDDQLRASLVSQASAEQERLDKGATRNDENEVEAAKARRDEIDQNLARLRQPGLSFIPDHFIWQKVPASVLDENWQTWGDVPCGQRPPCKMELVVGDASMVFDPKWPTEVNQPQTLRHLRADEVLTELARAVNNLHAGVVAYEDWDTGQHQLRLVPFSATAGEHLQLRYKAGIAATNILNLETIPVKASELVLRRSWLGLIVTWMLLSLGAPFWYDALKNLLKLRPTLAKKEEEQRRSRQGDKARA
jgi:hypothetical protein